MPEQLALPLGPLPVRSSRLEVARGALEAAKRRAIARHGRGVRLVASGHVVELRRGRVLIARARPVMTRRPGALDAAGWTMRAAGVWWLLSRAGGCRGCGAPGDVRLCRECAEVEARAYRGVGQVGIKFGRVS